MAVVGVVVAVVTAVAVVVVLVEAEGLEHDTESHPKLLKLLL